MPGNGPNLTRVGIVMLTLLFTLDTSILAAYGNAVPDHTEALWNFSFALLLAVWVRSDRGSRQYAVPFEYDAFVFFAWPLMVPYYLYRTRGKKGWWYGAGIWMLAFIPHISASMVRAVGR